MNRAVGICKELSWRAREPGMVRGFKGNWGRSPMWGWIPLAAGAVFVALFVGFAWVTK
jgi:hypothetical protein